MNNPDEPILETGETAKGPSGGSGLSVKVRIQRLVNEQPYAVLCVGGGGQPYGASWLSPFRKTSGTRSSPRQWQLESTGY